MARLTVPEDELAAAWKLLSAEERERANRFAFERDRRRYVVARAGLRRLLSERLGFAPQHLEFKYGEFGKPALVRQPGSADLRFSLSHTEDLVVYALAEGREVGVDIEAIETIDDRDRVATACFSKTEQEAFFMLNESERTQGFFNCWTRKEALVKAIGDGMSFPLKEIDVTLAPDEPARILALGSIPGLECGWVVHSVELLPGYAAAVVIEQSNSQQTMLRNTQRSEGNARICQRH